VGKPTQSQGETRARAVPRRPAARDGATLRREMQAAYLILRARNGHLDWWPGRTRTEVIVGAILTQNTAWTNVELAIRNLRAQRLLTIRALRDADPDRLAAAIRPSGYFRQKTLKLKAFVAMLDREHAGSLARMSRAETGTLRAQLLDTWGIGPETADSILLYAFDRPVFVVDAYTSRVAVRHGWAPTGARYAALQELFMRHLPQDRELYNDYHAQLVWVGKHHCGTRPRCEGCPLAPLLPGRAASPVADHI
jgi:endonuclease III related protein